MNEITSENMLRFPLLLRLVLKGLCICCGILALVAAFQFASGLSSMIEAQRESLIMSPAELGKRYGECVGGPIAVMGVLSWLGIAFWRLSAAVRNVPPLGTTTSDKSLMQPVIVKGARVLSHLSLFAVANFALELALGAYAIVAVNDHNVNHALAKFDYVHELYVWLPAGATLISATCAAFFWKIGHRP